MAYILVYFGATLISLVLTYRVRGWAGRAGLVDRPDSARRIHDRPTPCAGGIAIYIATMVVLGCAAAAATLIGADAAAASAPLPLELVLGGTAMFVLGLWDDARQIRPRVKLIGQLVIAAGVFAAGLRIESVTLLGGVELPLLASFALTVVWIVGITNAFNLIDGSDGVAAGAAIFAALAVAAVFLLSGEVWGAVVAFTLAGATLGFLFFNFPPASIFLGDAGSLFIGFVLAALGVITSQKASTILAVAIPVVSFGLPILDTTLVVVRRYLRGQPIFEADRGHIHHRLRDLGHSPRKVALLLYGASAGFAFLSILLLRPAGSIELIAFLVGGVVLWTAVQRLNLPELTEAKRTLRRSLSQRRAISANVRIREAAEMVSRARSWEDVFDALEHAVAKGEVARAELWVSARNEGDYKVLIGPESEGDVCAWIWEATPLASVGELWEVRLPLADRNVADVGHLSLWFSAGDDQLLTDLRLLSTILRPELRRTLAELHALESVLGASLTTHPAGGVLRNRNASQHP